ncbi:hypothetical protein SRDD_11690 [Serratia sp. DD3]|nr:hypothetical protein SRDD_11690 [Serratia sp. DD3]
MESKMAQLTMPLSCPRNSRTRCRARVPLNGFILFIGASIGPFIVPWVPDFVPVLMGLAAALLLATVCVASSVSLALFTRKP